MVAATINSPAVSVLMPVYNAEQTVLAAAWSVLNQSYENFEFIIYLDGCTDGSAALVRGLSDPRIKIIESATNTGIVHARNTLFSAAKGEFIAWIDADDIWLPGKLAFQYEYVLVHPNIHILGTWAEVRNSKMVKTVKWPTKPGVLDAWLFFRNPLIHSSVMLRKSKVSISYNEAFEYLEDYHLACSFLGKQAVAIYPKVLCSYLEVTENKRIDTYLKYDFVGKLEKIMAENFSILDLNLGKNELSLIREFLRGNHKLNKENGGVVMDFLMKVNAKNNELKVFNSSDLGAVISWQILRLFALCKSMRTRILFHLLTHPIKSFYAFRAKVRYD